MPRVRLIQVAARRPSNHPVEEPRLFEVGFAAAQPALNLAQEVHLHPGLGPAKVLVEPRESEVVPVDYTLHALVRMVNGAGIGLAPDEAEALQGLSVEGPPSGWRGPSTAQT
eukprot:10180304-Alexandrium_andersonii.AAC.1